MQQIPDSSLLWAEHDFGDEVHYGGCWLLWVEFSKQMADIVRRASLLLRHKTKHPARGGREKIRRDRCIKSKSPHMLEMQTKNVTYTAAQAVPEEEE